MDIIKVNQLKKTYENFTAVNEISFSVEKGSLLGFLGVNGAGKTTVINMLSTLLAPDSGDMEICGEKVGIADAKIREKIGMVYQQNCLDDMLSVKENLICRGIIHGATRTQAAKQCSRLVEILQLEDILNKKYRMLSGGQKRRCEIAAALMHTPEILFLDEPTTGLDPATRIDVWKTIEALQRNEKMTVFLTTHYMEEAANADQIIILDHGNIITSGTPFALKEQYAKDKLKLYYPNGANKEILLSGTLEALPIIEQERANICGFEVIQGTMDDVFLNAVDKIANKEVHL